MIRQCQWLHNLAGNDNDTVRIMKDWSRERCRGWQALTYRKFELHRVCPRIFPQIVFTLLQICARSWLTFVVVNLTAAGAKNLLHISDLDVWVDPVTSQRSIGVHMDRWRVKDKRNIAIEHVQVREERVGKLRLSNMHIPICLLLTVGWRELYYAQRTCLLGECQTKYRMSAFVAHYGNLCVHL